MSVGEYRTLSDMYTEIGKFIQNPSASGQIIIKNEINKAYSAAEKRYFWPNLVRTRELEVTISAGTKYAFLPREANLIYQLTPDPNVSITPWAQVQIEQQFRNSLATVNNTGRVFQWSPAGEFGIKADIATAETLNFVSSDAGDTSKVLQLWGLNAARDEVNETITTNSSNGTTVVTSTNSFVEVNSISTDATRAGIITVTGTTSSTELATISANEATTRYKRIRLFQTPDVDNPINIIFKKHVHRLINDDDIPEIPISNYLIEKVSGTMLRHDRQYTRAERHSAEAEQILRDIVAQDAVKGERIEQSYPAIGSVVTGLREGGVRGVTHPTI